MRQHLGDSLIHSLPELLASLVRDAISNDLHTHVVIFPFCKDSGHMCSLFCMIAFAVHVQWQDQDVCKHLPTSEEPVRLCLVRVSRLLWEQWLFL